MAIKFKEDSMKHSEVKIGMKVTPFQKTSGRWNNSIGDYINKSGRIGQFLKENGFLYVVEFSENINAYALGVEIETGCADYFNSEDFKPYISPSYYEYLEQAQDKKVSDLKELKALREFKSYFDSLYGIGLEVKGWHQNGNLETFDSFYESAIECMCEVNGEENQNG
jgi:hypothetical protein